MSQQPYYAAVNLAGTTPVADHYADPYYSLHDGLAESDYVFLHHNQLESRFQQLDTGQIFVIGETGFGCGINFLNTLKLWRQTQAGKRGAKLHFISLEKHPLSPQDLAAALANFPTLSADSQELLQNYYLLLPAHHRLSFADNVELSLVIGEASCSLAELDYPVDCWYLDGFSPRKNPAMWSQEIFNSLARLSHTNTTFATYTASSQVSKGLSAAGFHVNKAHGFASKREMLYGSYSREFTCQQTRAKLYQRVIQSPQQQSASQPPERQKEICIIGAGISGAATAYLLACRGYQVRVFEKNLAPATEASGNYQGILYGSWSAFGGTMMELSCAAYRYSHRLIKALLTEGEDYLSCGLIQLGHNPQQHKRNQQLSAQNWPAEFCQSCTQEELEQLIGVTLHREPSGKQLAGLHFPLGLCLRPQRLVEQLLKHPNIQLHTGCKITHLKLVESDTWQLWHDEQLLASTTQLVLCNAHAVREFSQTTALPLRKIRGQVSEISRPSALKKVVCGDGYVTPSQAKRFVMGATFQFDDSDPSVRASDHALNLANFNQLLPELCTDLVAEELTGKTAFRASPSDYLPLVGAIADYQLFRQTFAKLKLDKNAFISADCPYLPGLFLNIGHGAKGMLTAPYCAALLVDYIEQTPLAASENLRRALHPNRFYVRELVKGR